VSAERERHYLCRCRQIGLLYSKREDVCPRSPPACTGGLWKGKSLIFHTPDHASFSADGPAGYSPFTLDHGASAAPQRAAPAFMVLAPETDSVSVNGVPRHFEESARMSISEGLHSMKSSYSPYIQASRRSHSSGQSPFPRRKNSINAQTRRYDSHRNVQPQSLRLQVPIGWNGSRARYHGGCGMVNLVASNKGPVERRTFPSGYRKEASWIHGIESESASDFPRHPDRSV